MPTQKRRWRDPEGHPPTPGKQAAAERIHQMSMHQEEPFRVVPCASVSNEMLREGSAAGGLFEAGTVYLEEVADLDALSQEALPCMLAAGEGRVCSRLICGSARDLEIGRAHV